MDIRRHARQRLLAWARRRQGEDTLPCELATRRLYILPTRAGITFALMLFVMFLAGINYGNGLVLGLCFLLAAWVLSGMHETQRTLRGLRILQARADDCRARAIGQLHLLVHNPSAHGRHALALRFPGEAATRFELQAGETTWINAAFLAGARGRQRIERLELATLAPIGLFRAWTWLHLPLEAIIYPQPAGSRARPASGSWHQSHAPATTGADPEQWAGFRAYAEGDSPRAIAWKAWARGAPLLVSAWEGEGGAEHLLDWDALAGLATEERLGQLAAWVEACEREGSAYALAVPGLRLPLAHGREQRIAALRALALHGWPA